MMLDRECILEELGLKEMEALYNPSKINLYSENTPMLGRASALKTVMVGGAFVLTLNCGAVNSTDVISFLQPSESAITAVINREFKISDDPIYQISMPITEELIDREIEDYIDEVEIYDQYFEVANKFFPSKKNIRV